MARGEELTDERWAILAPLIPEPPRRRRRRRKVERLWAWLQNFRRVATRFGFHVENFPGFVHLGCIQILLRCYL